VIAASNRHDIDSSDAERWFGAESMKPVHALNEYLLSLLAAEVLRPTTDSRLHLAMELREATARLDAEGFQRAAHGPVALVDAGFRDDSRWAAAIWGAPISTPENELRGNFPHLSATRLAHMTLNLASNAAQINLERACLVFGMSPACAQLLSGLSLPTIERLAEAYADWFRPRWERRPDTWRELLDLAERPSQSAIPSVGLRTMQLQLGDLALATPVCAAIRQIRR
jgi:hypothetical protein